jgi:rhomboid protease GluP
VSSYPHDPRAHLYRAAALIDAQDMSGAEAELRTALADEDLLRLGFTPVLEAKIRSLLALILADRGEVQEAKPVARPVCAMAASLPDRQTLLDRHLCD